jgi:hypothetical protein
MLLVKSTTKILVTQIYGIGVISKLCLRNVFEKTAIFYINF